MKQLFIFILLSCLVNSTPAQTTIDLSTDKTSSLVFYSPIVHVDRGAKLILVQAVKDAPNVLLLKAGAKNFTETNLSVVTSDGSVYSFAIRYAASPQDYIYKIPAQKQNLTKSYADHIIDNPKTKKGISDRKWQMVFEVSGIYVHENVLYFQLQLTNNSPIDYETELLRFFICDRKKAKRTTVQEQELTPIHVSNDLRQVKAMSRSVVVVAVQKFTVPDAKQMLIQLMEKNGGRHLQLKVNNRKLMQSIRLPSPVAEQHGLPY